MASRRPAGAGPRGPQVPGDTRRFVPRESKDPATGRATIQLTEGADFTSPLYYFGPTVSAKGDALVFQRIAGPDVELWRLDLPSGLATLLATGVTENWSVFCPATEEVVFLQGHRLRGVHLRTLATRTLHELPPDRAFCGIPALSPDGRHATMIHGDKAWFAGADRSSDRRRRHEAQRCHLDLLDVRTGEVRPLVIVNSWITHSDFHGNDRVIFCHHPTECAILMTDLRGGWYTHLRTQTTRGWIINHYVSTAIGIMYEMCSPLPYGAIGCVDPETKEYGDFATNHPIGHVGNDRLGKIWFGDYYRLDAVYRREIGWLPRLRAGEVNEFVPLTRSMPSFGGGQRGHVHPLLMPDRKNLLFTGPDERTETSHMFLLDVSDLANAETDRDAGLSDQRPEDGRYPFDEPTK